MGCAREASDSPKRAAVNEAHIEDVRNAAFAGLNPPRSSAKVKIQLPYVYQV